MEPANLKSDSPDDAQLDAWLRAQSAVPRLPDDGFSQRVLAALPPPQSQPVLSPGRSNLRQWLCLIGALAGTAMVFSTRPASFEMSQKFAELLPSLRATAAALSDRSVVFALIATAGSLAVVYWREISRKLRALSQGL